MYVHIVMFDAIDNYNGESKEQVINGMIEQLMGLPEKISEIKYYVVKQNVLNTEGSHDFVLVSKFDNETDFQKYVIHPEHHKVVQHIIPRITASHVVDYNE